MAERAASVTASLVLSDALRMELAPWDLDVTMLTLGTFATDMRSSAERASTGGTADRYEAARQAAGRLVAMLDRTASDPGLVADVLIDVL